MENYVSNKSQQIPHCDVSNGKGSELQWNRLHSFSLKPALRFVANEYSLGCRLHGSTGDPTWVKDRLGHHVVSIDRVAEGTDVRPTASSIDCDCFMRHRRIIPEGP